MIKVAYFALAPFISGSERCIQLMLENAKEVGIEPFLVTPAKSPMKKWAQDHGVKHFSANLNSVDRGNAIQIIGTQLRLFYFLKLNRIQIVHSNQIWSFKVIDKLTQLLRIKRVCHFRDPINSGSQWWLQNKFDAAIFISQHIEKEFNDQFAKNHVRRQATLIDPVRFSQSNSIDNLDLMKKAARKRLNICCDKFIFGSIGQIAPVKGIIELLQTLAELDRSDWYLLIAGEDPSEDQSYIRKCQALIESLNLSSQVIFIGFLDDTQDFYNACDLITMFSLKEPLGLIPLEAAVNYTPTIANRVGGLPETIIDTKTGWLVDIGSTNKTLRTIKEVMDTDLSQIGKEARAFVESRCLPAAYMKKLLDVYKELI